jgi:O-antigen ligase
MYFLRISLFLLLLNAFLNSAKLDDGLFTAKTLGLFFAAALTALFACIHLLRNPVQKIGLCITRLDLFILGYLFLLPLLHGIFGLSLQHEWLLVQGALGISYLGLRVLCLGLNAKSILEVLVETLTLILCFQLLLALGQHLSLLPSYFPGFGPTGMFFNPGPFAIFTASILAFTAINAVDQFCKKDYIRATFYFALLGLGVYFLILSTSRSAWIGIAAGISIPLLIQAAFRYPAAFRRWRIPAAILFLLVLIPACWWLYNFKSGSADGRMLVWTSVIGMIQENGLTGVGIGNFAASYVHAQAQYLKASPLHVETYGQLAGDSRYAFNDFLQLFAETGIIGVILFCYILYLKFKSLYRTWLNKQMDSIALPLYGGGMSVLLTLLFAGLSAYPLQMIPILILFWVVIVILISSCEVPEKRVKARSFFILLLLSGCLLYSYQAWARTYAYLKWTLVLRAGIPPTTSDLIPFFNVLKDRSGYLWSLADAYKREKNPKETIALLEHAVTLSPEKSLYYKLGEAYEQTGDWAKAEECYQLIADAIPNLLRPHYLLTKLHLKAGNIDAFRQSAKEALELSPKILNDEVIAMQAELKELIVQHRE